MSFWQKIKLVMSNICTFLEPFVIDFLTETGKIALEEAMKIIPQLALSMASADGTSKREAAIVQLKSSLLSRGIEISTTLALDAIQTAYKKLKADGVIH